MTAAPEIDLKVIAQSSPAGLAWALNYSDEAKQSSFYLPHHLDVLDEELVALATGELLKAGYRGLLVSMPPRHGKELDDDTEVLTPNGWKRHGDLSPGDSVFSPGGLPVRVLATERQPPLLFYRITFSDGSTIDAAGPHEWSCLVERRGPPSKGRKHYRSAEIIETHALASTGRRAVAIPVARPVEMPERVLPISPYVLGVWLGDGTAQSAGITVGTQDIGYMAPRLAPLGAAPKPAGDTAWTVLVPGLQGKLRAAGLLRNKHVPRDYMMGSVDQRMALLRGLMDADGYVSKKGQCEFTNTNKRLAWAVYELVCSLGAKATIRETRATLGGRDCGPKWRVGFYMDNCFTLPRKQARCGHRGPTTTKRYVRSVEPLDEREGQCIQVEGSLYLAGRSLIPTHNSELCSHYLPPWYLGRWPERHVAEASYEADFAATWGRKSRETLEEVGIPWFGVRVDHRQSSARDWRVAPAIGRPRASGYGGMVTTGIGGPLTGRGADLLIVDDPVKNALEAHSLARRQATWDWFTSTAMTRLEPGGVVLIVATRWHEDDLIGRLLASDERDRWKVINFPAIADYGDDALGRERGEALWPERWPADYLAMTKAQLGSYVWNSLYQGKPADREGGMFETDWLRIVTERPAGVRRAVRAWDTAATEAAGDYTVGLRLEALGNRQYLISDVVRGQWSEKEVEDMILATARADGRNVRIRIGQERGSAGKLMVDRYRRLLVGFQVRGIQETGDKELRARGLSAAAERGDLLLLKAPWNDVLRGEYVLFPHGANDDQVDAGSLAYEAVARRGGIQVV